MKSNNHNCFFINADCKFLVIIILLLHYSSCCNTKSSGTTKFSTVFVISEQKGDGTGMLKHGMWFVSNYQLNAQILYSITVYMLHYNPQHISSSTMLIFRRTNCIIIASAVRSQPAYCMAIYREWRYQML